ncbi:MAG TPA: hypothetical protein VMB48_15565 [Steroidobacteraceae bacterium]|nr:hypothetical protein [Steroidobacteraceae bacterium]
MPALSEWLQLMLGEIAAKRDQAARAEAERQARSQEQHGGVAATDTAGAPAGAAGQQQR